jgi:hypothetical protein
VPAFARSIAAVIVAILAGCASPPAPTLRGYAGPVVMEWTASRSTRSGEDVRLGAWVAMTISCAAGPVELRVAKQPANGMLSLTQARESPGFPRDHPFASCNDRVVMKKIVSYRPSAGYAGADEAVIEASFPDQRIERTTYRIKVLRTANP